MFKSEHANIDEDIFEQLCHTIEAINIALKTVIPNLQIELIKKEEVIKNKIHIFKKFFQRIPLRPSL